MFWKKLRSMPSKRGEIKVENILYISFGPCLEIFIYPPKIPQSIMKPGAHSIFIILFQILIFRIQRGPAIWM